MDDTGRQKKEKKKEKVTISKARRQGRAMVSPVIGV
jgi:hypothetical protein